MKPLDVVALALLGWVASGAACAPASQGGGTTPVFDDDDDVTLVGADGDGRDDHERLIDEPRGDESVADAQAAAPVDGTGGRIDGAELDAVLDAGPGAFLSSVEVRPVFSGKRFRGWELTGFRSDRLARSPLRRGDMVVAVNERGLRRPEDLQRVWDDLRGASELVVEGVRSGRNFALRYEIVRPADR